MGLTGAAGSGKSTVARMFKDLGLAVVSTDEMAHAAIRRGTSCFDAICAEFGEGVLGADGEIDREALGRIVFEDERRRKTLQSVVHPVVLRDLEAEIAEFQGSPGGAVGLVAEIPLLFEVGLERQFDAVVCCVAEPEVLVNRLMSRGLSREAAQSRLSAQFPQDAKAKQSDYVVRTDCSPEKTRASVAGVWRAIEASMVLRQGESRGEERISVSNGS